jgi:hypothetical protein
VLAYKADRNEAAQAYDAVDTLKHGKLLHVIRDQETRITELEGRELAFIEELDKRANLVKQLEAQVIDLERITQEKSMNTEEIKKYITQNHSLFHQKIDETKVNVANIDQHINSILKMAQHTVDIIQQEERNRNDADPASSVHNIKSRLIHIDQISIPNIKKESEVKNGNGNGSADNDSDLEGGVSLDPFVVFKLTDEAIETKKLFHSGVSPTWEHLNIELQAMDDECNEEYNKLRIEVWDDFSMNVSNELLCEGSISFVHLDLLHNRGPVMTSVDLFDSSGKLVTTAKVHINVVVAATDGDRIGFSTATSSSTKAEYDTEDQVMCNYGGEGEWLPGRVARFKKIRDRSDTRRLYEIEFANGDMEVNVPISRLRDVKLSRLAAKSLSKEGAVSAESGDSRGLSCEVTNSTHHTSVDLSCPVLSCSVLFCSSCCIHHRPARLFLVFIFSLSRVNNL